MSCYQDFDLLHPTKVHLTMFDLSNPFKMSDKELGRMQIKLKGDMKILLMSHIAILEIICLIFMLDRFAIKGAKMKKLHFLFAVNRCRHPIHWHLTTLLCLLIICLIEISNPQDTTEILGTVKFRFSDICIDDLF